MTYSVNTVMHILVAIAVTLGVYQPITLNAISRAPSDKISIYGRGWGHGVGMCQEGARGMADAGYDSDRIIKHFYRGVEKNKTISGKIRIVLLETDKPVRFSSTSGFVVYSKAVKIAQGKPGEVWEARVEGGGFTVESPARKYTGLMPPLRIVPQGGEILRVLNLRYTRYRGEIDIDIESDQDAVVINEIDLEKYLYGVVPSEVPGSWPQEALKAQAIVARCYALRNLGRHDLKGSNGRKIEADLCKGPHCQVYKGFNIETTKATKAVDDTVGVIYRPKAGGNIINAFFHACCGGHTEDVNNVWGGSPISYLKGVVDPFCSKAITFRWQRFFTINQMKSVLSRDIRTRVRSLTDISVVSRGNSISSSGSQRVLTMSIFGSGETKKIKGSAFKSIINRWAGKLFPRHFPGKGPQTINETWFYVFMPPQISAYFVDTKYFSPNRDGTLDSGKISVKMPQKTRFSLIVKYGSMVIRKIFEGNRAAGLSSFLWNGKDSQGKLVADGRYKTILTAVGPGGAETIRGGYITVDNLKPVLRNLNISTSSFNPRNGQSCSIRFTISDEPSNRMLLKVIFRDAKNQVSRSWKWLSVGKGLKKIVWDGKSDSGESVPKGEYRLETFVRDQAGNFAADTSFRVSVK